MLNMRTCEFDGEGVWPTDPYKGSVSLRVARVVLTRRRQQQHFNNGTAHRRPAAAPCFFWISSAVSCCALRGGGRHRSQREPSGTHPRRREMSGIFYNFNRGENVSRRRVSSSGEQSPTKQARARGMLRKMKAKVGEAISPRERNEVAKASSAPASPATSAATEAAVEVHNGQGEASAFKRRPSVTIAEEWNEYNGSRRGASGDTGNGGWAGNGGVDEMKPHEVVEQEENEYVEDEDEDDESDIMVDVGSEKEVATRLPSEGSTFGYDAVEDEEVAESNGQEHESSTAVESYSPSATNISTDGEEEEDASDSDTEATTSPDQMPSPTTPIRRSKPRFKLSLPQRKDPGTQCSTHAWRGVLILTSYSVQVRQRASPDRTQRA